MQLSATCSFQADINWKPFQFDSLSVGNEIILLLDSIQNYSDNQFAFFCNILTKEENERVISFQSLTSRKQFILGHYLIRKVLASIIGIAPETLRFGTTVNHKPVLINNPLPVHFNISHSGDLVLLGFSKNQELGVDIEKINRSFEYLDFSSKHFSHAELEMLKKDRGNPIENFFLVWTRKEAWLKLTGEGIHDDLQEIEVSAENSKNTNNQICITSSFFQDYVFSLAYKEQAAIGFFKIDKRG